MKFPDSITLISDEVSQDLTEVRDFIRRFNLSGFELRSMFGRAFKDLTDHDLAEIRATVRGEGWRIHGCATPVFKCTLGDTTETAAHLELFKRSLDVARSLDCDLVRVFTFLRQPSALDAATIERVAGHMRELFELASSTGVRVGIENESSCLIGSGEEVLQLLPHLPVTGGGIIWDPCNVLYVEGAGRPVTDAFARMLPRIIHIHMKDAVRRDAPGEPLRAEPVPVGLGDVNWRGHLAEIGRSGYQGLLSLETHWRVEQIDEKLLHLPAGHAFSKGGAQASDTCLRNIQSLCSLLS